MRLPSTRTMPKPRLAAPGSIPITTCMGRDSGRSLGCLPACMHRRLLRFAPAGGGEVVVSATLAYRFFNWLPRIGSSTDYLGHDPFGDVEVGVDLADVVVLFE